MKEVGGSGRGLTDWEYVRSLAMNCSRRCRVDGPVAARRTSSLTLNFIEGSSDHFKPCCGGSVEPHHEVRALCDMPEVFAAPQVSSQVICEQQ
jgi:hypothetical protein